MNKLIAILGLVFLISLVPFILFAGFLEGLAMANLGASQNAVGRISRVSQEVLIRFQLMQLGLTCVSIVLGAKLFQWVFEP